MPVTLFGSTLFWANSNGPMMPLSGLNHREYSAVLPASV